MKKWIKVYPAKKAYFAVCVLKEYPKKRKYVAVTKTFDEMLLILTACGCTYRFARENQHAYFDYPDTETSKKMITELEENTKKK